MVEMMSVTLGVVGVTMLLCMYSTASRAHSAGPSAYKQWKLDEISFFQL